MEVSNLFVCAMGMGVTFFGLTCLILLTTLLSKLSGQSASAPVQQQPAPVPAPQAAEAVPNRQELIAAISVALAEELGTDVKGIRILSLKKIS